MEDIPGTALVEGIQWRWESFPEYLDRTRGTPCIDVGLQIPHGALRGYVMGDRAARLEAATAEDVAKMRALVKEGLLAGALGFSTSRTEKHRDRGGNHTPSFRPKRTSFGVLPGPCGKQMRTSAYCRFRRFESEFALIRGMAETAGRPLSPHHRTG